jgi:polysaccharide lyase-like protein
MKQSKIRFLNLVSLTAGLVVTGMVGGFKLILSSRAQTQTTTPLAAVTPSQAGTVLWSADMESSSNPGAALSQWYAPGPFDSSTVVNCLAPGCPAGGIVTSGGGVFNSGMVSVGPSFDVAHSGTYSAKLTINTPDAPESGTRLFRWLEPQRNPELYYSAWYYFPQQYTPNGNPAWWNVFQWKSKSPILGDNPFISVNVSNRPDGTMYFFLRNSNLDISYDQTVSNIPVRQWTRLEAFYRCAEDSTGEVAVWHDGVLLFDVSVPTRVQDGDCQWSVNNYSSSLIPNPSTIYIDDAAICLGGRCP